MGHDAVFSCTCKHAAKISHPYKHLSTAAKQVAICATAGLSLHARLREEGYGHFVLRVFCSSMEIVTEKYVLAVSSLEQSMNSMRLCKAEQKIFPCVTNDSYSYS